MLTLGHDRGVLPLGRPMPRTVYVLSLAAALINLHPLFATGVAILLLGERVTAPILAGTVVIVFGTILLSIGGRRGGIRPWQITLPLLSAACFGVVAVLRKLGLAETGAVLGSAINVTTALVAFTATTPKQAADSSG